jgi:type IV pilus assembly protein PilE
MTPSTMQAPPLRGSRGFTLIELMITVAIVAILSAIAYPAYQDSVRKGKRAEGRTALTDMMQQQERYFTQTGTYLSFAAGATGVAFKTFSGDNAVSPAYKLGAEACDVGDLRECVRVFAVPQFTDTDGGTLRIVSTGLKDCTGAKPAVCWR